MKRGTRRATMQHKLARIHAWQGREHRHGCTRHNCKRDTWTQLSIRLKRELLILSTQRPFFTGNWTSTFAFRHTTAWVRSNCTKQLLKFRKSLTKQNVKSIIIQFLSWPFILLFIWVGCQSLFCFRVLLLKPMDISSILEFINKRWKFLALRK